MAPRGKHPFWPGLGEYRNDSDCDNLDPNRCSPAPNSIVPHWKVRGRSAASGVLGSEMKHFNKVMRVVYERQTTSINLVSL